MDLLLRDDDHNDLEAIELILNGIPRKVYTRSQYFDSFDLQTFFLRFRLSKEAVLELLPQIEDNLEFPYINNCVSPINQLLLFLRFCATGSHLSAIGDFCGVHTATAGRIVERMSRTIAALYHNHINFPRTAEERLQTQHRFFQIARFPRVIGAIDCTYVPIQSPGGVDAEIFRNRKNNFSINVQVICNANLEAINLVARWPGSAHDSTIYNNCQLKNEFEDNVHPNMLLIGDSGYICKRYLITPLIDPRTPAQQLFNESHKRTRNTIERYFGVWKRRFPVIAYGCRLKLETVLSVIVSTAVINNICKRRNEEPPPLENEIDFLQVLERLRVPDLPHPHDNMGINFRNDLIDYFKARRNGFV